MHKSGSEKKFLFYLGHPAHYHNISIVAKRLKEKGHSVVLVARAKDVLFHLIDESLFRVYRLSERKGDSKASIIMTVLYRELKMMGIVRKEKPDLMIGTDIVIAHIGKLLGISSLILNEDDADQVPLLAKYGFKYSDGVVAPHCCRTPGKNKIAYPGYHELAYLHPECFTPDENKVASLKKDREKYFILRFANLSAHHDVGKKGVTDKIALKLVNELKQFGRVYITSERKLETALEPYRISIPPEDIHHALYFSDLYIGDSQTMTAEAAVLGTPAVRFNDFVGKLSYLEELEHKYQLTFGIPTSEEGKLFEKVRELVNEKDIKAIWKSRKERMLKDVIKVADFWLWLFENFPQSKKELSDNPELMERFKK